MEVLIRFNEMIHALDEPQADLAPENVRLICYFS